LSEVTPTKRDGSRGPRHGRPVSWSEEEDRILLAGLEAGHGPARISRELPHRTNNAVIGRINRQQQAGKFPQSKTAPAGIPSRPRRGDEAGVKQSRPPLSLPPTQKPRAAVATVRPEPQPIVRPVCDDAVIPIGQGCGILELTHDRCKWVLNDPPRFGAFIFCGGKAIKGLPYCGVHAFKAFQPAAIQRRPFIPRRKP
jgi:GcrA cell cycle regulator